MARCVLQRTSRQVSSRRLHTSSPAIGIVSKCCRADFTFQFELRERLRDRAKIFLRHFLPKLKPNERDRVFLSMPRALSVAYYILRPVRLALERMRKKDHLH